MSWLANEYCPICGADGFDADCDEVDIGVGVQEFNLRGMCRVCGLVSQCGECGKWLGEGGDLDHSCEEHLAALLSRRDVPAEEEPERTCPHGEPLGECVACDVEGDLAYDAERERR